METVQSYSSSASKQAPALGRAHSFFLSSSLPSFHLCDYFFVSFSAETLAVFTSIFPPPVALNFFLLTLLRCGYELAEALHFFLIANPSQETWRLLRFDSDRLEQERSDSDSAETELTCSAAVLSKRLAGCWAHV